MSREVNMELAYRCQMLPGNVRSDRTTAVNKLLKCGWPQRVLDQDIDGALAWANSQCMVHQQEKIRRTRARKKEILKGNDAVEAMFASAGVSPDKILPNG